MESYKEKMKHVDKVLDKAPRTVDNFDDIRGEGKNYRGRQRLEGVGAVAIQRLDRIEETRIKNRKNRKE